MSIDDITTLYISSVKQQPTFFTTNCRIGKELRWADLVLIYIPKKQLDPIKLINYD